MRTGAVLSPRGASAGLEDLASRGRLIAGQRIDRHRWRRRVARRARWVAGRLGVLAAGLGGVAAAGLGTGWLLTAPRFAVATVDVSGQGRLGREEIEAAAAIPAGVNIFRLDTRAVTARLEQLTLVRRARVTRALPSRISIAVEERTPFTLVNAAGLHWIDEGGVDLGPEPRPVALGIPVISGLGPGDLASGPGATPGRLGAGLAVLRLLMRLGGGLAQGVSEIDMSRAEGPVLYTLDGVEVRLGQEDWEARLGRLVGVLGQLRSAGDTVASIDLRFRDQVVLKNPVR